MDSIKTVNDYLTEADWRTKEAATSTHSLQGLNGFLANKSIKEWWLSIYPEDVKKANNDGYMYIHDLSSLSSYCGGYNTSFFLNNQFVAKNGITSNPPKHLNVAFDNLINWIFGLSGEFAGAQALSHFDILLAPYIREDKMTYEEVYQAMEGFIYKINFPGRIAMQSPFSNITMDLKAPKALKDQYCMIGGEIKDYTYGELQKEINMINKAFASIMMKGDAAGSIFSFPIPTFAIDKDFDWDVVPDEVWAMTASMGIPYFGNYMNSDMNSDDSLSMCCFSENQKFISNKGTKAFNEFEEGEKIIVPTLCGKLKNATVNTYGVQRLQKVTLSRESENKVVFVTQNHRWILEDELETQSLKKGDKITQYGFNEKLWVVTNIEPTKREEKVWCLDVEDEHNFILEGFIPTGNCRLKIDLKALRKRSGGLFGSAPDTGAIGVVTLSLPMIAHDAKGDKEKFFKDLRHYCGLASESLEIKRNIIESLFGVGPSKNLIGKLKDLFTKNKSETLYPFAKIVLQKAKDKFGEYFFNHFSVIGIIGGYELCKEFDLAKGIVHNEPFEYTDEHIAFLEETLHVILDELPNIQEKTGHLYNLEFTPAESASYTLGKKVQKIGGCTSGTDSVPYLTNSTLPHASFLSNLDKYLAGQNVLQILASGGSVSHLFLGQKITAEKAKQMVRFICENYKIPYFSLTPTFSICKEHGYISGKHETCPECNSPCDIYSRVVGFYKKVSSWNEGKVEEFNDRTFIDVEKL